jgi:ribosome biogenesis GTPase
VTNPDDKQRMRDRHGRAMRHIKTREEEQQIADARRARGHATPRRRSRAEADDEEFEKMQRRERVLGHARREPAFTPNSAQLTGHERPGTDPAVVAVGPRKSRLVRVDPHNEHRERVLAANVDVVVLVLTADRPRTGLIDRLKLALADSGASLAVCVNKCDLEHDRDELERLLRPHRQLALPIAIVSATRGDHLDELEALVRGRTVAFVGHSGVGKSTLLNRLDPEGARATGEVRDHDGRGRHTTAASSLRVLADGTRLIDTPGVRAFGLPEGTTDAIAAFEDVQALATGCRFRDCAHVHEPGCAVRAAAERGDLVPERYRAFLELS